MTNVASSARSLALSLMSLTVIPGGPSMRTSLHAGKVAVVAAAQLDGERLALLAAGGEDAGEIALGIDGGVDGGLSGR